MSKHSKRSECIFCHKKFHNKGLPSHKAHCKSVPKVPESNTIIQEANKAYNRDFDNAMRDQRARANNVLIEFTASVSRMNNALATIIAEWRFS
jgi:hypothetical protein